MNTDCCGFIPVFKLANFIPVFKLANFIPMFKLLNFIPVFKLAIIAAVFRWIVVRANSVNSRVSSWCEFKFLYYSYSSVDMFI